MGWAGTGLLVAIASMTVLVAARVPELARLTREDTGVPAFLQPNRCYRLTFSVAGAPNWKVLELGDHGWITANVDAGPASARRETVWINTAQIITAREARCSE
jgi:hypothetical protein